MTIIVENERAFDPLPRVVIGDSLCRFEKRPDGLRSTDVVFLPGGRICHIAHYINENRNLLRNRELLQIMVGTNDLSKLCNKCIVDSYRGLVRLVKTICPDTKLQICSQIPRPIDFKETKQRQIDLKRDVKKMCKEEGVDYAKIHTGFIKNRLYVPYRYASDRLHLNAPGQATLETALIRAGSKALGCRIDRELGRGMVREERKDRAGEEWMTRIVGHELC